MKDIDIDKKLLALEEQAKHIKNKIKDMEVIISKLKDEYMKIKSKDKGFER